MIDVDYSEYKETLTENMKLIRENHDLKERLSIYESDSDTVIMAKEKWEEIKAKISIEKQYELYSENELLKKKIEWYKKHQTIELVNFDEIESLKQELEIANNKLNMIKKNAQILTPDKLLEIIENYTGFFGKGSDK